MIQEDFLEGIEEFKAITNRSVPREQRDAWWRRVQDWDGSQFIAACRALANTEERIPSFSQISTEIGQRKSHEVKDCIRCNGTGVIPFFRVRSIEMGGQKHQSGSFVVAKCSCESGNMLSGEFGKFEHIQEFQGEPERTAYEYAQSASDGETRWLKNIHWPMLYKELPEGRQKQIIGKELGLINPEGKAVSAVDGGYDDLPF